MIRNHNHLFHLLVSFLGQQNNCPGDGVRLQTVCHQLNTEPFAESRFTRRGWTGDKNQFYSLTVFSSVVYPIGNIGNLFSCKASDTLIRSVA